MGRYSLPALLAVVLLGPAITQAFGAEERLLNGFETEAELNDWQVVSGAPKLVTEGVTQGQKALEITFDPKGEWFPVSLFWNKVIRDWSAYDALVVDVFNPNAFPIDGSVLVADQAWADKGRSYWNRHNGSVTFAPGKGQWLIPVKGLYRGEPGSRNNDIKTDIDSKSIIRLDLNFGAKGQTGRVVIDNLRFVKVDRVQGVSAFDFGPPSQAVMPGWTPVSHLTVYTPAQGYGWGPQGGAPWDGADRDTTFGTMLTRDFCEAGGYNFHVDVPAGLYQVLVIYENCGYWGGEQSLHRHRGILVDNIPVWSEERPDGPATALYRFEDVDPVKADLWDTYMAPEITKPIRFQAEAKDQGITFQFQADVVFGSKVSALALHRADDAAAAKWLDAQLEAVKQEFRAKAVCLDPPAAPYTPPAGWSGKPLVAWPTRIEDEIVPDSRPAAAPAPADLKLSAEAVRGEYEPMCLVVRPTQDLGACRLKLEPGPDFPSATVQVVRYNTSRGFGTISYHIKPHTLRAVDAVDLPKDLAREIVVTVNVPADAKPDRHEAKLTLTDAAGATALSVPLSVNVHDLVLSRETEFRMGFFGLWPPDRMLPPSVNASALEETLRLLREHGMNALCGAPSFKLTGWKDGQPQVDFAGCDEFFALARKYGFTGPINGYDGPRFIGLHDGYEKGDTAKKVEQESGLDYETAFLRAWEVVDKHARASNWPLIYYAMCDETRVRDVAERELEFMKLMAKASARFPQTVRTSGAYSVDFTSRPTDEEDLKTWHQRFFSALDISDLNLHDQTVMAEAQKLGKEVHIYNQGTSRYSFGLYQWSEFRKGVRARWQWHLNILHGYQFFDLDGREPDTAMICYGRQGLYPTIDFERCREGAEDFYLYQTLAHMVDANRKADRKPAETTRAAELLDRLTNSVTIDQRDAPPGFDAEKVKLEVVKAMEDCK